MSDDNFDVKAFIQESKEVLVNPRFYFSKMKTTGGLAEPLIKAAIYGAVAGVIAFILSLVNLGAIDGGMFGGAFGIRILIWRVIGAIIGLLIGSVVLLVVSSICRGNTSYEANARVVAAVMVVLPISALLGFAVHIDFYLGTVIGVILNLFAVWLIYHGLVNALKSNIETTKIVTYVLIALIAITMIFSVGKLGRANKMLNEFNKKDVKEVRKNKPENK
jgi:hypothetical protein